MPVSRSDIALYKAANEVQTDAHGGGLNRLALVPSNIFENLIKDISPQERATGKQGENARRHKSFFVVNNTANLNYKDAGVAIFGVRKQNQTTGAMEYINWDGYYSYHLRKGTLTDTWATAKTGRRYGMGLLAAEPAYNATTYETTLLVNTSGQAFVDFKYEAGGDNRIVITNLASDTDETGTFDTLTLTSNPVWNGDQVALKISGQIPHAYTPLRTLTSNGVSASIPTRVSSVMDFGTVKCTFEVLNNSSAHGLVDEAQLFGRNVGAIEQVITITFAANGVDFTAVSNVSGVTLSGGNRHSEWSPSNSAGQAYLYVSDTFWLNDGNGDWASSDTIQIVTHPPAMGFYVTVEFPPNTPEQTLEVPEFWCIGNTGST